MDCIRGFCSKLSRRNASDIKTVSETRTLSPYERLPIEIHDQIFVFAEQSPSTTNDNPLFKTFRQVSRHFKDITTPRLFHTVVLYQHADRWEALNKIARQPELAKQVKLIQLSCLRELSDTWEVCACASLLSRYQNYDNPYRRGTMADYPPEGGPLALLDHSSFQARFERYRSWNEKERFVAKDFEDQFAPTLDLQLFGPLAIETLGPRELSTVKRAGIDTVTQDAPRPNYCTRRHAETGIHEHTPRFFMRPDAPIVSPRHMHLFLYANKAAGANITSLTLHHVCELLTDVGGLEVPNLRRLRLDFGVTNSSMLCSSRLGVWLLVGKLKNLEELVVIQYPETEDAVNVIGVLGQTHFPGLLRLTLTSPETTYEALVDFVKRHIDTLQHLRISTPVMRPSDWSRFLSTMREVERSEPVRYLGKNFDLAPEPWKAVKDSFFEEAYWNARWRRPQTQRVLRELSLFEKPTIEHEMVLAEYWMENGFY